MSTIYCIANQKGGVGKTTTAEALTDNFAARGKKVLAVDLDAQGNLTFCYCAGNGSGASALGVLTGEVGTETAVKEIVQGKKYIIPASKALSGADGFITDTGKEYRLREALEPVRNDYDFIVIDTPPALGILTVNALTAADRVVIPAQADIFSLQGISELSNTIALIKKYCNRELIIDGVLLTRFNPRSSFNSDVRELAQKLAGGMDTTVFDTVIRESISVKKAQVNQKPLCEYDPKSTVAADYENFTDELIKKLEKESK